MVTTIHEDSRGALKHLSTSVQAIGLVYLIGFVMALLGATVALMVHAVIEVVSGIAGLIG
jgi:hypothetical protein